MKLTFVPALEADIPAIFQLNRELMHLYEDLTAIDYDRVLEWVENNIRQQLPWFRRVMMDGQLSGYFCLCPSEGKWELDSLFILPQFRSRGIGTAVVKHCLEQSEGRLFLYAFKANTGAVGLYQRLGFHVVREVRNTAYILEYENQGC